MTDDRILELMDLAVATAEKSVPEDKRIHPKVGAVLAREDGELLLAIFRNYDGNGNHGEHCLFAEARRLGVDVRGCTLFVTLEPCTRRGVGKTPCAVQVAQSGIKRIYIGTLDPNPHITGRGESFLLPYLEVERFPYSKQKVLFKANQAFFDQHRHEHIPAVSLRTDEETPGANPQLLAGQREGILQQTMELMTGSQGSIWIMAGRLSWLRELQLALVLAAMRGREIRLLCSVPEADPQDFSSLQRVASASGCAVAIGPDLFSTRFTLTEPRSSKAAMIAVEEAPALHALMFKSPHEKGLLESAAMLFEQNWERSRNLAKAQYPKWVPLSEGEVIAALQRGVPCYAGARFSLQRIPLDATRPLSGALERLKLARLRVLEILLREYGVPRLGVIEQSPWPIIPPVVEAQADRTLVVIDGAHRVYTALERGEEQLEAIIVEGVSAPLPAERRPNWDGVKVLTPKLPRAQRYQGYAEAHFRPISDALSALRR